MIDNPKKIAIFRTDRIGEVLLSTVAIDILKKNYPQAEIVFLTSLYSAGLLSGRKDLDAIILVNVKAKCFWIVQAYKISLVLRKEKFDMAVVLNAHKTLHLACFLAGISTRCGYDRKWGFLLTHRVIDRRDQAEKHEVEYTKEFFRGIGLSVEDAQPKLYAEDGMDDMIRENLIEQGVDLKKPLVIIHPCASNPLKFWSFEKYSALIESLNSQSCQLIIIGEQKEYDDIADIIADSACSAINAAGIFTLEELVGLLKISSVFIGNDSGPMHMAAALSVKVLAIFSKREKGSNPVRWRPWGDGHVIFHELYGEQSCELQNFSGYYIAKDDILVNDVLMMTQKFLNERN